MNSKDEFNVIKPDILIPFDNSKIKDSHLFVISVRPETNKIDYESLIMQAVQKDSEIIYMANFSGDVINRKAMVATHYPCQFKFALKGKERLSQYPEIVTEFDKKFSEKFSDAKIYGSFEVVSGLYGLKMDKDELFNIIVPEEDFLEIYGQTIKKYNDFYIVNYDMPEIIHKHTQSTNILVMAIRMIHDKSYYEINHTIYENFQKAKNIEILDKEKRKEMTWYNQIKRTYHMSRNHIQAMFDMHDYIIDNNGNRISFIDTPLGNKLVEERVFDKKELDKRMKTLKSDPLVRMKIDDKTQLVNIINEGNFMDNGKIIDRTLDECVGLIESVEW